MEVPVVIASTHEVVMSEPEDSGATDGDVDLEVAVAAEPRYLVAGAIQPIAVPLIITIVHPTGDYLTAPILSPNPAPAPIIFCPFIRPSIVPVAVQVEQHIAELPSALTREEDNASDVTVQVDAALAALDVSEDSEVETLAHTSTPPQLEDEDNIEYCTPYHTPEPSEAGDDYGEVAAPPVITIMQVNAEVAQGGPPPAPRR